MARRRRPLFTRRKSTRAVQRQVGGDPDAPSRAQFMSWNKFARGSSFSSLVPDVGDVEHQIRMNDDVLVWPHGRAVDETLKMDEYWLARVRDIRSSAENPGDVWVLAQWYYSPRDVADVIKSFDPEACGKHERIFSDHYDFIHSTTIDGRRLASTAVRRSDEDAEQASIGKDTYWCRYDFEREARTLDPKPSETCFCHHPYDPDDDTVAMHFCPRLSCRKAYHQSCLIKEKFKEPNSDEPFVLPTRRSSRSKKAHPERTIERLLQGLPDELVRVAKQPMVKGAKYPQGGIVGNITWRLSLMTSTTIADDWDAPSASTSVTTRAAVATAPVRDDWEDDEDEDEDEDEAQAPTEEANQRLWNDANTKPAAPMPTVVSNSTPTPPPAAFQPVMRILKRPAASSGVPAAPSGEEEESFREREARYQAARERIFGSEREREQPSSTVLRNPRGGSAEKGFTRRRTDDG
ncbi:hypothetical protein F5146DRAFT_998850 [Armillaria mellea]|nr:hypothetical protein F5146DRAFT_998850 [Armillaria mellea]